MRQLGFVGLLAVMSAGTAWGSVAAETPAKSGADSVGDGGDVSTLAPVVVTATRRGESNRDLPVSIDAVQKSTIQNQTRRVLVSEVLPRVPGTAVGNRGTFAQDDSFICTTALVTAPGTRPDFCSGSIARITATNFNPDDSGSQTYDAWTPALGLIYSLTPDANLYANVGKTFETPTFPELAYRPDGGSGLNFALDAATSWHYEIGAKLQLPAETRLNYPASGINYLVGVSLAYAF